MSGNTTAPLASHRVPLVRHRTGAWGGGGGGGDEVGLVISCSLAQVRLYTWQISHRVYILYGSITLIRVFTLPNLVHL